MNGDCIGVGFFDVGVQCVQEFDDVYYVSVNGCVFQCYCFFIQCCCQNCVVGIVYCQQFEDEVVVQVVFVVCEEVVVVFDDFGFQCLQCFDVLVYWVWFLGVVVWYVYGGCVCLC